MTKVTLIIGARGQGKSTFAKERVKGLPRDRLHVYDVQAEYFPGEPLPEVDDFLAAVKRMWDKFIVFEEATIFFPNRGYDKDMVHLLVSARHRRNVIFLLYHSISAVPDYIRDLTDYVVLLRTEDEPVKIKRKYSKIYPHFMTLLRHPDKCLQLQLYNGIKSPYLFIKA